MVIAPGGGVGEIVKGSH